MFTHQFGSNGTENEVKTKSELVNRGENLN
jgi:hypothetical protein